MRWLMAVAMVLLSAGAQACTATVMAPIIVNTDRSGRSDTIKMIWDDGTNLSVNGCPTGPQELNIRVNGADLKWVMDFDFTDWPVVGRLPLYETGPDSPLIGFAFANSDILPLRLGNNVLPNIMPNTNSVPFLFVFSRGSRMRDFHTTAEMHITDPANPTLDATVPISITMRFPPTTCPLRDVTEVMQDVSISELSKPGDTAKERPVVVRMDCGTEVPRADIMLVDAGDASNTGSTLTPTADSDAEGVRVQLLKDGAEVQFRTPWYFDPGVPGVHDLEFRARYIRLPDALKPGLIRGEAVLDVDYW